MSAFAIPQQTSTQTIGTADLGGGCVLGGENCFPFHAFEGTTPHRVRFALEVTDTGIGHWAEIFPSVYGPVAADPVAWARLARDRGADAIFLNLRGAHQDRENRSPAACAETVKAVAAAVALPLIIKADGADDKKNAVLEAAAAAVGRPALLGSAEEKNYRTLAAVAALHGHAVIAESPIDVNIAKQVNILLTQANFPLARIVMDPLTGGLGYGLEYTYSVMERLRLQAFGGDPLVARPFLCFVGDEAWKVKEAKIEHADWGDRLERGVIWELATAWPLILAGANLVVLRHPESLRVLKSMTEGA